jgi:nitric oxide reductase subunit C
MKRLGALFLLAGLMAACGGGSEDADLVRGRQIFTEHCTACHSTTPGLVIVGPSLAGVATRAADSDLEPSAFLRRAILTPQAEIVEGFSDLMPTDFEQKLTESDLEALISFLLTLE